MFPFLVAYAALLGAAGVASAAAGAHMAADPRLASMAQMLMIHAAACLALLALCRTANAQWGFLIAAGIMLTGVSLFSADIAIRVFYESRLFPMAAPIGGALIMAGWIFAAIAAFLSFRQA